MLDVIYPKPGKCISKLSKSNFHQIKETFKCVKLRRDLVYHIGKTKDREFIKLSAKTIDEALEVIKTFINDLAGKLANLIDLNGDDDISF